MQIISIQDNLQKISNLVPYEKCLKMSAENLGAQH